MSDSRDCIFVMGMHRSGTSALTGVLQLMGCRLGEKLMGPWQGDNPKGFFENVKVFRQNEHFLKECGSSWCDPCFYGADWVLSRADKEYEANLKGLLKKEIESHTLSAIKDPRLCILLPVWQKALMETGIGVKCVFAVRSPMEVAKSLQKRDRFSLEHGLLLWMNYMLTAELLTRGLPRVFLSFEHLIEDSENAIATIAKKLDIFFPRSWGDAKNDVLKFLDRDLRHYNNPTSFVKNSVSELVHECYVSFLEAATEEGDSEDISVRNDKIRTNYESLIDFFYNPDVRKNVAEGNIAVEHLKKETERCRLVEAKMEQMNTVIQFKDESIAGCETKIQELQNTLLEIQGSRSWKLAMFIKKCVPDLLKR